MIERITYKGLDAICLQNEHIKAIVIPSYGGKLASFYDQKGKYEWLFQKCETLTLPSYGASFSKYDSSGFDEVFPSIDRTVHPLNGKEIPDHGEVWALPWDAEVAGEELYLKIESPQFPYVLEKRMKLVQHSLNIEYEARNTGGDPFSFIWTPHALLNLNENTEIEVPSHLAEVMTVEHSTIHLGEWGTKHSYPVTTSNRLKKPISLNKMWGPVDQTCDKFYFTEKLREGWCRAVQRDINRQLTYEFPIDKVPYLGIWKTQGGYRGDYNFALEPCTGVYDDVYVAEKIRKVSSIPPHGSYTWSFNLKVEQVIS